MYKRQLLFSGGASINGGNGQVVLKAIIPEIGTPSRIIAIAVEDQTGTNANWSLSAYAICGNYAVVPVAAHTASNSVSPKSTTATCPTGKRVVGASAAVFSGGGQVLLDDFIPNSTLTAVTAKAYEDGNGYSANWDLIAYAMCADFAFPGLERRSADSSAGKNSQSPKTAMVGCSSSGKRVIGLGTAVDDGFGQVLIDDALPTNSNLTQVTVRAYEDETGHSQSWDILAYVICALP